MYKLLKTLLKRRTTSRYKNVNKYFVIMQNNFSVIHIYYGTLQGFPVKAKFKIAVDSININTLISGKKLVNMQYLVLCEKTKYTYVSEFLHNIYFGNII